MFSINTNNHYQLHLARQSELEADVVNDRLISVAVEVSGGTLRKRIGGVLILIGEKLAQEPEQDIQLAFSTRY